MADTVKEVIISLSRNIKDYPFTAVLDKEKKEEITEKIEDALKDFDIKFERHDIIKKEREELLPLLDTFYISKTFADKPEGRALFISEDVNAVIISNGENHIKVIAKAKGLDFDSVFEFVNRLDDYLGEKFNFAFSKEFGYLSPNIENIGTAMRASAVLHLGALEKNRSVAKITSNLSKLGLIIKPLYSDNVRSFGDVYILSNSVTMGITEKAAVENLKNITEQLVSQEETMINNYVKSIENRDTIFRSLGILQNARLLTYSEALSLISNVRLGIAADLIEMDISMIDSLILKVQPVSILKDHKDDAYNRMDEIRADIVRKELGTDIQKSQIK